MNSTLTPPRRAVVPTRLGFFVLIAFVLATVSLVAPSGALAHDGAGGRGGQPTGFDGQPGGSGDRPGAGPQGGNPGGMNAEAPAATTGGTTGASQASVTEALNLRAGPSLDSEILTVIPAGSTVAITGAPEGGFYPVSFDGLSGYASGDYLSLDGGAAPTTPDGATAPDAGADPTTGQTPDTTVPDTTLPDTGTGQTDIEAIICDAAATYGQSCEDMLRVANCESNLIPTAVNQTGGSYGLFQFLPSTWATTPYANEDIFDPVASANAAAWMWSVGRRNEWVCQ